MPDHKYDEEEIKAEDAERLVQKASDAFMELREAGFTVDYKAVLAYNAEQKAKKALLKKYPRMTVAELGKVEMKLKGLMGTGAGVLDMHYGAIQVLERHGEKLPKAPEGYDYDIPKITPLATELLQRR